MRRPRPAGPRASAPVPGPSRSTRTPPVPHGRLLVVDDHADTRDLLQTLLTTAGYEVILAEDGDTAQERYRERPADVVLMDLVMPRKDGVSAIRDLCAEFPGVTIVAMSGDTSAVWHDALAEARTAGARLTLRKPLEPWVLLRALEGLLAGRRSLDVGALHRSA